MNYDLQLDVMGQGCSTADIAIVGEAPGREEAQQKKPFVGPSGFLLNQVLKQAGITRDECWITNVVKYQPPGNNLKFVKNIPAYKEFLYEELKSIKPKIILALGNLALEALTGKKGIQSWRGSILSSPFVNNTRAFR